MNDDVEEYGGVLYQFYIKSVPVYFFRGGFLGSRGWHSEEVSGIGLV